MGGIAMKKSIIPLLIILVLGLCLVSSCTHRAATGEFTEPGTSRSVIETASSETSGRIPAPTAIPTPSTIPTPIPTPTPTPEPTLTPEPVFIYMDFKGNVVDKSVLDRYSEVDGVKYFVYEDGGRYGVKTGDGKILTDAIYDRICDFSQITKKAYVVADGYAGMIDLNGNVVIEPKYNPGDIDFSYYEGSLFFYFQDDKYGALDLDGNVVFEPKYSQILSRYGNPQYIAVVNEEGKSGIIDMKGNLVVACQYEEYEIQSISQDGYYFTWEGLHTIDGDNYTTHNNQAEIIPSPDMSVFWACSDDGANFGIFNTITGEYEYPPTGGSVENNWVNWGDAYFGILPTAPYTRFTYAGKEGIADIEKGTIVFEPIYETIEYCQNGYFKYSENEKYGLMDASGKVLLPCKYQNILYTSPYGEIVVTTKDGSGIVKTSGKILLAPQDTYQIGPYLSEIDGFEIALYGNRDSFGIANRDGSIRVEPELGTVVQKDWDLWDEEYNYTNTDFFILDCKDGDKILRNDGFTEILDYVDYSGELIIVQDKNGLMGLINSSGGTLIEPCAKRMEFAYNNHGLVCLKVVEDS